MSLDITALASAHARWSEARHSVLAGNLAHIDTPGARAMEMESFTDALTRSERSGGPAVLATTDAAHLSGRTDNAGFSMTRSESRADLQQTMSALGSNRREHEMNTAISAAFHRFQLAVLRG